MGVAVEVDGDGEGCDVGRVALDVDGERGLRAAVAGGSYPCGVDLVDQLSFEDGQVGIGVGLAGRPSERFLCEYCCLLERTAHTDPDGERWAGVRASSLDCLDDKPFHRPKAFRWGEHFHRAHVVAARALDQHREFQAVALDRFVVDDSRGVVARVSPVYGAPDDGFSEVAFLVSAADAFVYCGPDLTARDHHIASQLDKEDRVSRVLAERDAPFAGDFGVLQEAFDHLAPELRLLRFERATQGSQVLLRQPRVSLDAQVAHRFGYGADRYLAQRFVLNLLTKRLASEASCFPRLSRNDSRNALRNDRETLVRHSANSITALKTMKYLADQFISRRVQPARAEPSRRRRRRGDVRQLLCRFPTEGFS